MSFAKPSLGLRLTLWYAAFFIAGAGLVLTISYFLIARGLETRDHAAILDKIGELESEYRAHGRAGLKVEALRPSGHPRGPYFVRLCTVDGNTRLLELPPDIEGFHASTILKLPCPPKGLISIHSASEDNRLDLISTTLPDGMRLQVGLSDGEREDLLEGLRLVALLTLLPVFLIAGGAGYLLARRALSPLRDLVVAVAAIEAGNLAARVPVGDTGDELDALSQLFNRMLNRISQLITGMRESLDEIAHDLRTPAARLQATAETALNEQSNLATSREALAECLEESQRVCATLDTLMDLAEAEAGAARLRCESLNVRVLLDESVELFRYDAAERGQNINLDCPADLTIHADRTRMRRILANLLDNAVKYGRQGGRIRLLANAESGRISIVVEDDGPGIAPDDLPRVFERLYRSERDRDKKGLGLGLSLVKALVQAQGGTIEASNALDHTGARFVVQLPPGDC